MSVGNRSGDTSSVAIRLADDFNHLDPAFREDPYPLYAALRSECPVARGERYGGFWALQKYDDIVRAAGDPAVFSSRQGITLPDLGAPLAGLPMESDPPDHPLYRQWIAPYFSAKRAMTFREPIRAIANELIDGFIESGEADLVAQFARLLPPRVLAIFLGVPEEDGPFFAETSDKVVAAAAAGDTEQSMTVILDLLMYVNTWLDRRSREPADDLATLIIETRLGERELTDNEKLGLGIAIIVAGQETVSNALGSMLFHIGRSSALKERLLADPSVRPTAIEEFLRFDPPIPGFARTAETDVDVRGTTIRAGEKVLLMWASANHDEDAFDRPEELVLDRRANRHLTFGSGPHVCPGAPLARLELRIALDEILRRLPDYQVTDGQSAERCYGQVRGFQTLPVVFTAGRKDTQS